MELTTSERKIFEIANTSDEHNHNKPSKLKLAWLGLIVGVFGGSMLVIYGVVQLVYHKPDSLTAISYGLLLIGSLAMMYENLRFKSVALSLIRKLTNEQKGI
jgi:hypothetical protein